MQKVMTLVPFGGIGNRISAIESAIRISKTKGYDLSVVWFKDWGMKADFEDLFQPLECCQVIVPVFFDRISLERPRKHNLYISAPFQGMMFDKCFYEDRRYISEEELLEAGKVYISSCYEFFKGETDYTFFRPSFKVAERVKELTADFKDRTIVGVHVRRSDNIASLQESPLALFEEAMRNEADNVLFYLSSDDDNVKKELSEKFPGRILTDPLYLPRGSYEAECEAVAELFALSKCSKIIGSYNSSFGLKASQIGRVPFQWVVRHENLKYINQ